ncbi:hypothetical protein KSF78_0002666 [Schistosoma japonicum]|nr:hypothetical protein KSF78_0002666 [Schistosoma japonicum]
MDIPILLLNTVLIEGKQQVSSFTCVFFFFVYTHYFISFLINNNFSKMYSSLFLDSILTLLMIDNNHFLSDINSPNYTYLNVGLFCFISTEPENEMKHFKHS